ncbi:MAG: hypothetical protein JRI77_16710, partial [Deltaproteobacteria bacterium]|nr:hypothetical protein [Deltaproteobacteria bacterium]
MSLSKEEAIKKIESQEGDSVQFEVFEEKEHKTFLENHLADQVEKKIGVEISKVHQQYDDDLFETTGERKQPTEKTYDAYKRIMGRTKKDADLVPVLKKEIEDLKKGKVSDPDEKLQKEYNDLQTRHETYKAEMDKKIKEMETGHKKTQIMGMLDRAITGLKFSDSVPENVRKTFIETTKASLVDMADISEGTLVFRDKEGIVIKNENNSLHPYTAEEIVRERLKEIIDEGRKLEGPGKKPELLKDKDGKDDIIISLPDNVLTKDDLTIHLAKLG